MKYFSLVAIVLLASISFGQSQTSSTIAGLNGLISDVTVRRDARSIPYIDAKSDADVYFVQGYITASDRLFQMDLLRRVARGETAEIFGKSTLEEDKRWRRFGFAAIAEQSLQQTSPELQSALESYSKGVNAYIASLTDASLPVEFRVLQYKPAAWRASDAIVIGKILADALSTTWRYDLLRASLQSLPKDKIDDLNNSVTPYDVVLFGKDAKAKGASAAVSKGHISPEVLAFAEDDERIRRTSLERVGLYAEELAASNNLVVSGKHTVDGKPILANDPHLMPSAPGIWYLTHLTSPSMRVSGVTVPGIPGIILGHNAHLAWGATNVGPDVQDLYLETFNNKGEFKTPTGWVSQTVRNETIKVRPNSFSPATENVAFSVISTRNGPITFDSIDKRYSMRWTALDSKNIDFETFYLLNRAKDWKTFKLALARYGGSTQNFVYADVKGNIGWYAAGKIPLRRTGDGSLPYDGSTSDGDWIGTIPFTELPNLYNPPSGIIVTANQRIVGTGYKYSQMIREVTPPWRARRIVDALEKEKGKINAKVVSGTQYDAYNIPLAALANRLVTAKAASQETLAVLSEWDGHMENTSSAALIVNEIRGCLASRIAEDNKPATAQLIRERILFKAVEEGFGKWLPSAFKNDNDFYIFCDARSREALGNRLGETSRWVWGSDFKARFPHPLDVAPLIGAQFKVPQVPLDGSGQTPNVGAAVSMRHVTSPGNWDATTLLVPLGQSGNPQSPHYLDQFGGWAMGYGGEFPFTSEAVKKASKALTTFRP